jgi:hypothetical protein
MPESRFLTKWYKLGVIYSKDGYSVRPGRDRILYFEDKRVMTINADMGPTQTVIFSGSIGRWDEDPSVSVNDQKKQEILKRVRQALESQGETVRILEY